MEDSVIWKSKLDALSRALSDFKNLYGDLETKVKFLVAERNAVELGIISSQEKHAEHMTNVNEYRKEIEALKKQDQIDLEKAKFEAKAVLAEARDTMTIADAKLANAHQLEGLWNDKNAEIDKIKEELLRMKEKAKQLVGQL